MVQLSQGNLSDHSKVTVYIIPYSALQTTERAEKQYNTIADIRLLNFRTSSFSLCFSTDLKHDTQKNHYKLHTLASPNVGSG